MLLIEKCTHLLSPFLSLSLSLYFSLQLFFSSISSKYNFKSFAFITQPLTQPLSQPESCQILDEHSYSRKEEVIEVEESDIPSDVISNVEHAQVSFHFILGSVRKVRYTFLTFIDSTSLSFPVKLPALKYHFLNIGCHKSLTVTPSRHDAIYKSCFDENMI